MNRDFNTLLIPVESQVRELDGKLLLACVAAESGYTSIIGSRAYIHHHASKVRDCIYLAKSMRRFSYRMFKILHGLGHRIVAWDEEGLVRLPDQQYYTHRLCPNTFNYIDHLFAWGDSDAQVFKNYSAYKNQPIHTVGNPRIDLLRPELCNYFLPEAENLVAKYGEYILINTNFGQVNHFIPSVGSDEANRDKNFSNNSNDSFISKRFTHKQALFNHFKQLIPLLAEAFPNINFVLRPHPSENLEHWKQHLQARNNIIVANNDNVIPWIMGSKALISNGCTTSIEATILQKPTLGYYPITDNEIDDQLPKSLSDNAATTEQLIEKVKFIFSGNLSSPNNHSILTGHISNLSGDFSADKIINTLGQQYAKQKYPHLHPATRISAIVHNNARTKVKNFKSKKASHRNSTEYHEHRFPAISTDYLYERVERLQTLTGRFSNLHISKVSNDIFKIYT